MDTYKIAIDTFLAETSECKASGCAVFSGGRHRVPRHPAAHAPEQVRAAFHGRTHHAFHPQRAAPLPLTLFKNAPVKTEIRRAVRGRSLFKGEQL